MLKRDRLVKRILMSALGVCVCGASVGMFKLAAFGVDPFQTFMAGLDAIIPIDFGTLYVIANVVLLLFSFFADKRRIGLATFINLFLLGYIADFSHKGLMDLFPNITVAGRAASLIIAIVIMCFASAMYFTADLGVSTYDAVALVISETWKIGKFKYVRVITDFICVALGVALYMLAGGKVSQIPTIAGVGTIVTAFFMGPLIDFFKRKVAEPFLQGPK